jgi:hypothetical protein
MTQRLFSYKTRQTFDTEAEFAQSEGTFFSKAALVQSNEVFFAEIFGAVDDAQAIATTACERRLHKAIFCREL